jgi:type I restriction enzyme S subunit
MDTKKLRQKILDLAIRGKLVSQDPNDEPASVLIEKIRSEKEQLIKEKRIKRDKNESYIYRSDKSYYEKLADGTVKCIDEEIPFEIPESWEWCRLGSVVSLISGQDFPPDKYNSNEDGIPYIIGASNIFDGKLQINRWTTTPSVFAGKGDLLLVCKGAGVGKMCLCDLPKAHIARQIQSIRVYNNHISIEYIKQVLDCRIEDITSKANGLIPGLNRELILNFFIPIPPVDEQKKINQNIISSFELINSINRNKLDLSKIINQAKSKILDLAIRGKLVPQDPNDEPASVLLERIKSEHPESKKKAKNTGDNSHYQNLPFEIPKNWMWVKGYSCFNPMESTKPTGDSFIYIDIDAIDNKAHKVINPKTIKKKDTPSRATRKLSTGDTLFSMVRPYLENCFYRLFPE